MVQWYEFFSSQHQTRSTTTEANCPFLVLTRSLRPLWCCAGLYYLTRVPAPGSLHRSRPGIWASGSTVDGLEPGEVAVEYLSRLGQQLGLRERLLDQRHVWLQAALGGQHGPGVPGHEQHLDAGFDDPHSLRDFLAEHPRHDHVGDQQVDLPRVRAGDLQRGRA